MEDAHVPVTRLLEQLRQGDESAVTLLYEHYRDQVHRRAQARIRADLRLQADPSVVAETALRQALADATHKPFLDRNRFAAYLQKKVTGKAIDAVRRASAQKSDGGRRHTLEAAGQIESRELSPSEQLEFNELVTLKEQFAEQQTGDLNRLIAEYAFDFTATEIHRILETVTDSDGNPITVPSLSSLRRTVDAFCKEFSAQLGDDFRTG